MEYILDFIYGSTKYPCAWLRPSVRRGYFQHKHQELFFDLLINSGFQRTFWQLVFPGQTAGLVKKISNSKNGANEWHIRFYSNGSIDCELEYDRWDKKHWTGERQSGTDFLHGILHKVSNDFNEEAKLILSQSFRENNYSMGCNRRLN